MPPRVNNDDAAIKPPSFEDLAANIKAGEWKCHPSKNNLRPRDLRRYYNTLQRAAGFVVGWEGGWNGEMQDLLRTWLTKPRRGTSTAPVRKSLELAGTHIKNTRMVQRNAMQTSTASYNEGVTMHEEEMVARHWIYKDVKRRLEAKRERVKTLEHDYQMYENKIEKLRAKIGALKRKNGET